MALASPSERPPSHRTEQARCASHGIRSRVCPAVDIPAARPLPATLPPRSGSPPPGDVPRSARGFAPPRRFTPRRGLGFIAPRSRPGFIAFCHGPSMLVPRAQKTRSCRRTSRRPMERHHAPRNAVHTLRRIPLASSRTASPRPLPSCSSVRILTAACRSTLRPRYAPTSRHRRRSLLSTATLPKQASMPSTSR